MKERMKKMTLLAFYQDKKQITDQLQELGVLHIESPENMESAELDRLKSELDDWKKATAILEEFQSESKSNGQAGEEDTYQLRDRILGIDKEKELLHHQLENIIKEENQLLPWGNFNQDKLKELEKYDIYTRFYVSKKKEFNSFDFEDVVVKIIDEVASNVYFIVFLQDNSIILPFEKLNLPRITLDELIHKKSEITNKLSGLNAQLSGLSYALPLFRDMQKATGDKLANNEVLKSFEDKAKGKIVMINGWFPEKNENQILKFINENGLSFEFKDPEPGDQIPVILRNRKYPKIFENITRIFQLPNYYEFDLTPFIAVFYPIFFAYCLGDAGYGVILLIISIIAGFTFLKSAKPVVFLGLILGFATLVMGIVKSGTVFGLPITQNENIALFGYLSKYVLVTDEQDYVFNAFNVALMIGVFQIIVAVIISIFKKIKYDGVIQSFSTFGKLFMIISLISLFLGAIQKVELFIPFVPAAKIGLILGVLLVLLFHDTMVTLPKRIGSGILPLYFIVTGLLGDVLSYIRLFALGVASSILGLVVNQIGAQILDGAGFGGILLGIFFLIIGHTLNFLLACLGSFVHPLRLTFVEFYNNVEFKGGGVEYKPFKKQLANNITDIK